MLNILTLTLYFVGSLTQALSLWRNQNLKIPLIFWTGIPAVILHGYLLYGWIDSSAGQNLTEFNLLSLAAWVTSCLILLMLLRKPIAYLAIFIFPLSGISILLATGFPAYHIIQTAAQPKQMVHILLSIITFSVLSIAGLQAVTLAFQEKFLKQKYFEISQTLPPIETMENLLFQMIAIGSLLLSAVLASSIYFFHNILIEQFLQKTILTFIAWFVFTSLLIGRYYFGWRGRKAIYCTLGGVVILSIIYFSSLIIMELLP